MVIISAGVKENTFAVDRCMKVHGRISDDVVNVGTIYNHNNFPAFEVNGSDLLSFAEMQTIMQKLNELMYENYVRLAGFDNNRPVS